jgi:hypothetical protein
VKVTDCPATDGVSDVVADTLDAIFETVTVTADDADAVSFPSPPYDAEMLCVPTASVETESEAEPPLIVDVPNTLAPSRNCTVPVDEAGETDAVSATL